MKKSSWWVAIVCVGLVVVSAGVVATGQDLNTMLSYFAKDLASGLWGTTLRPTSISTGLVPSTAGAVNLTNATYVTSRNSTNTGDGHLIGMTNGDQISIGPSVIGFIVGNAVSPFMRFGGITSSFPALKRNGAVLEVRLGDDSGFAGLAAKEVLVREDFNEPHLVRLDPTFAAQGLAEGNINVVLGSPSGIVTYREEGTKAASHSSWIDSTGSLNISGDHTTDNEGVEIYLGDTTDTDGGWVVAGTRGGCFTVNFTLGDNLGTDQFFVGWRAVGAFSDSAVIGGYTEFAGLGLNAVDGSIVATQEIANASVTDDSGVNMADGDVRAFKSCVAATGIPTAWYTATGGTTFTQITASNIVATQTAGTVMAPFIAYVNAGAESGILIHWWEVSRP